MPNVIPTQILICEDKSNFLFVTELDDILTTMTNLNISNNIIHPSLVLDVNRKYRIEKMKQLICDDLTINYKHNQIQLDPISSLLNGTPIEANFTGLIQFNKNNKINLFPEIKYNVQYHIVNIETTYHPSGFQIFPIMLDYGCIINMIDIVEKVLIFPVITNKLIGHTKDTSYYNLHMLQKLWPELNFEFNIKNNEVSIYSDLKDIGININSNGIFRLHRNFGSDDLKIHQLYSC